jgi:hypothetical protein
MGSDTASMVCLECLLWCIHACENQSVNKIPNKASASSGVRPLRAEQGLG